ncbi:MAG: MFS transporter [Lentimonas sp.]
MKNLSTNTATVARGPLIAYGLGGLIPIALYNVAEQLIRLIGNIGLGLSAYWLGVVLILPRLWDAVSDPLMGHITDNTRSRWGRRRPYIFLGAIIVAISFCMMWWIPQGETVRAWFSSESGYQWFQLSYILALLLIFYTACTIFEIPHGALGMEMSSDRNDRTLLFSSKSFFGNLFAMGTPWLFALANLEFFKGTGGNLVDGMRMVSLLVAAVLIPLAIWWFFVLREPAYTIAKTQKKTPLRKDLKITCSNRTFLKLVLVIFTLAMGFNFVSLLSYYITIFYLYAGDKGAAGPLLGINGTIWAITGLVAVFPLNWISRRAGKRKTLALAILLMCAAQLAKIVCYNPELPYLVIIPTILLSAGMLMFFTLGSSMVGDICDEDDLNTGTRSEGSYYSVYWWFIKMGTALASFVTGALLVLSQFDETQAVKVDALEGQVREILAVDVNLTTSHEALVELRTQASTSAKALENYFLSQVDAEQVDSHYSKLGASTATIHNDITTLTAVTNDQDTLLSKITELSRQSPLVLLRLRVIEIGIPLLLCLISLGALRLYPLTEEKLDTIKEALDARNQAK